MRIRPASSKSPARPTATVTVFIVSAALAGAAPAGLARGTTVADEELPRGGGSQSEFVLRLPAGETRRHFRLERSDGVVLLFRLTLPRGTRAQLSGRLASVAGVGMTTDPPTCRERGAQLICEQSVEWCPLPRGTWNFVLRKLNGPPGLARLEFRVDEPPT
jgi:hypothetical protein